MSEMSTRVADDLREAMAVLHLFGWQQYSCGSASSKSKHDLVGALMLATGSNPYGDGNPRYLAAYRAVSDYLMERGEPASLLSWNDQDGRTVEQIYELLRVVISQEKKYP